MWHRLRGRPPGRAPAAAAAHRHVTDRPAAGHTPDAVLRRLEWTILRPLARYLGGEERSLVRGPGMELSEIREYQPSDDPRFIDWSVTARSERVYVREAFVERALDAWLVVDVSSSVDWGTVHSTKRGRAVEFAAIAGRLLGRNGNRVGAVLFADRPLGIVPPGAGRPALLQLLRQIQEAPHQERIGPTDLTSALHRANSIIQRRSLVLVITDFLAPDGWQRPLGQLAQRHEVVAVRLEDPRELDLPDIGYVTFEDPETGMQITVDTGDRKLRQRYHDAAAARSAEVHQRLAGTGVDELVLSTGSEMLPEVVRFLNARRYRRGRQAAHAPAAMAQNLVAGGPW